MQRKGLDDGETWVSITDLMTGMMAMFMLIALVYMFKKEKQDPLRTHRIMEENIFNALKEDFKAEEARKVITVDSSLTLRFIDSQVRMFAVGEHELQPGFKDLLDSVLPKFLKLVTRDTILERLAEIRVEGHANSDPDLDYYKRNERSYPDSLFKYNKKAKQDFLSYAYNLKLSQERARSVLRYIRSHPAYLSYNKKQRERLDFLFSATGMSFSRRLDKNGHLVHLTKKPEDKVRSVRVEFKIVTSRPEGLVDEISQLGGKP